MSLPRPTLLPQVCVPSVATRSAPSQKQKHAASKRMDFPRNENSPVKRRLVLDDMDRFLLQLIHDLDQTQD